MHIPANVPNPTIDATTTPTITDGMMVKWSMSVLPMSTGTSPAITCWRAASVCKGTPRVFTAATPSAAVAGLAEEMESVQVEAKDLATLQTAVAKATSLDEAVAAVAMSLKSPSSHLEGELLVRVLAHSAYPKVAIASNIVALMTKWNMSAQPVDYAIPSRKRWRTSACFQFETHSADNVDLAAAVTALDSYLESLQAPAV